MAAAVGWCIGPVVAFEVAVGAVSALAGLWCAVRRDARKLASLVVPTGSGYDVVREVLARFDPEGRTRVVVDPQECTASAMAGRRPVVTVSSQWLVAPPVEFAAVLAHEFAHVRRRHGFVSAVVPTAVLAVWAGGSFAATGTGRLAATSVWVVAGLAAVACTRLGRARQRHNEFAADADAVAAVGADALAAALRRAGSVPDAAQGPYSRYPALSARLARLDPTTRTAPHSGCGAVGESQAGMGA